MSMSRILLDRCLEEAVGRGVDVSSAYEPWLPVDLFQTLLVDIHEHTGCTWLSAIDARPLWFVSRLQEVRRIFRAFSCDFLRTG